jgi:hypothetical protein
MFSIFLIFYSLGILAIRGVEFVEDAEILTELGKQLVWSSSVGLNVVGMIVGVLGMRAVSIKSRGTSLTFFSVMCLYDVLYLGVQGYFLWFLVDNLQLGKTIFLEINEKYSVKIAYYYFLLTFFILVFMSVKAYRFHSLLCMILSKKSSFRSTNLAEIKEN